MPPIPKKAPTLTAPTTPKSTAGPATPPTAMTKGPKPPDKTRYKLASELRIGEKAITQAFSKKLLGWEDELAYKTRIGSASNGKGVPGFGTEYLFKDPLVGNIPIMCWNNTKNRPFDLSWAKSLAQTLLFSGPTLPSDKRKQWHFNGEPVLIGEWGQILSGQHRLIALIIACALWNKNKDFYREHCGWKTEPVLETILTVGISEDPDVIMTIDCVKPRKLSDVFYTSPVFAGYSLAQKKAASDTAAGAVTYLWNRTGVVPRDGEGMPGVDYQSHQMSMDFFDRHQEHLLLAIAHISKLAGGVGSLGNAVGRPFTEMYISNGAATGMLYLMGCSATDPDDGYLGVRSEAALDWSRWDDACKFWKLLAEKSPTLGPLWTALKQVGVGEEDIEDRGRTSSARREILIAKAWALFINPEVETITSEDLEFTIDGEPPDQVIVDADDFGGIDLVGPVKTKKKVGGAATENERAKQEAKEAEEKKKLEAMRAKAVAGAAKRAAPAGVRPAPAPLKQAPVPLKK